MSEDSKKVSAGGADGTLAAAGTEIAYCPHLGIYHYRRADGEEAMFDTLQLEQAIEGYQKVGNVRPAEFLALLTGFARQFPHQVVAFDKDGQLNLHELLAAEIPVDEEAAGEAGEGKDREKGGGEPT